MTEHVHEVSRKQGVRLSAEMFPLVHKDSYAPMKGESLDGFHMFDKAHMVMITEQGIIPEEAEPAILKALRKMETEGRETIREDLRGHLHCGEAYATMAAGPELAG